MTSESEVALRGYLMPGERVLWQGKPEVRPFVMRGAWFIIPFSLLWGGFAIAWEVSAILGRGGLFFALWGIPFVLLGLYMIFGRLFVAKREAERTRYAITDRRVLVLGGAFSRSLVELDLDRLPGAQLDESRDGVGTITFGTPVGFMRLPPGWPTMGMYRAPSAFQSIRDVRRTFDTLQQARTDVRFTPRPL